MYGFPLASLSVTILGLEVSGIIINFFQKLINAFPCKENIYSNSNDDGDYRGHERKYSCDKLQNTYCGYN